MVENAFCEHYGNKPEKRDFAIRVFKTSTRKGQNGHFLGQSKMSKKWGYNYPSSILAIGRFKRKNIRILNEIFSAEKCYILIFHVPPDEENL